MSRVYSSSPLFGRALGLAAFCAGREPVWRLFVSLMLNVCVTVFEEEGGKVR